LKLCLEYLHEAHFIALDIPKWLSLGIVVVIFIVALIYARIQGSVENGDALTHEAEEMLAAEEELVAKIDGDVTK
jgi:CHASE3 domain sensor protein